jgi:hypothetical protein
MLKRLFKQTNQLSLKDSSVPYFNNFVKKLIKSEKLQADHCKNSSSKLSSLISILVKVYISAKKKNLLHYSVRMMMDS